MSPVESARVYVAVGHTDMRKSTNGLSILVEQAMDLNPFSGDLFVFCNRLRTIVKILYWDRNGFCLWHKRLEKDLFQWPSSIDEVIAIDQRQLQVFLVKVVHGSGLAKPSGKPEHIQATSPFTPSPPRRKIPDSD